MLEQREGVLERLKILYPVFLDTPNSSQRLVIASPSRSRATNFILSSTIEHSFHPISSLPKSGAKCNLCVRNYLSPMCQYGQPKGAAIYILHWGGLSPPFNLYLRQVDTGHARGRAGLRSMRLAPRRPPTESDWFLGLLLSLSVPGRSGDGTALSAPVLSREASQPYLL
jgi:hypothetical protein